MPMKPANLITALRVFLSPIFFLVFFMPIKTDRAALSSVIVLWILFTFIEISDLFDGKIARARKEVSDFGKLLDPFADSFSRLTYFLCFVGMDFMPLWVFLLILYRDLSVSFVRLLMAKRGIAMGARISGKVKAFSYAFAGIAGIFQVSVMRIPALRGWTDFIDAGAMGCYILAAAVAIWTLVDYVRALLPQKDGHETH